MFNQVCFPLMHHATMPAYKLSDHDALEVIK